MNYLRVKHILLTALFISFSLSGLSQKTDILVVRTKETGITEWQILDGQYRLVISGNDFDSRDSVFFGLEPDNRYLLQVYIPDTCKQDTTLMMLHINGEPVLSVKSDGEPGDRFLPFFTGKFKINTMNWTTISPIWILKIFKKPWLIKKIFLKNFKIGNTGLV